MGKPSSDPRQRLLDAGLKQFANQGYAGTSVQDITKEAKVTKPTLYYYFESKAGLFQALVDQAMDERMRLICQAASPEKETVDQLTDIIVAVTDFARRQPDLLRLCFSVAFAAPGEIPLSFKKHDKMIESYEFVRELIKAGLDRGVLNPAFTVDELTQAYFHLVQHSVVLTVFESKLKKMKPPVCLPPKTGPRRKVELFLCGAANRGRSISEVAVDLRATVKKIPALGDRGLPKNPKQILAKALALVTWFGLSLLSVQGQSTNTPPVVSSVNYPATINAPDSATNASVTNASPATVAPTTTNSVPDTNAVSTMTVPATNAAPDLADVRPVPLAVKASHPELATVSPIEQNALDPHAIDLQTCFQLTAVRDDSLKISTKDIEIARAQLSQSIAALWPTFTATNEQQFLHYRTPAFQSFSILGDSTISGNRDYTSQSHVTMNYTILNGGQNWNAVGASSAAVAAKRETLARDYETIYQSVAQAFYNVLQFEGDMAIQSDLIEALQARVDDLKDRVTLGRSRPSELLQAQTDLANAKVTYESQKGSLNAARETVAFYIGIPSDQFKLKETQKFPTAAQLEAYLHHSGERPDVLSQLESLRQAERNLSVAQGQLWPTITANGDFLASQDPATNQIDGTMTLEASMPIFDGGLIIGQIHQNKEMVRQSRLNLEQLQRTADEDTRTAYVNFTSSISQVIVLREAALLAAKNLEAQVDDYRRGVVSNLDVLTALQDYQSARQQLHNSNMQARLNLINLHVAAGMAATGPNANNQALPASNTVTGVAH